MRLRFALLCLAATFFVAGCAGLAGPSGQNTTRNDTEKTIWSGRLSLQVDSNPPQFLSAGFELQGNANSGQLLLTTPLGSTAARVQWSPGSAELTTNASTRRFATIDELLEQLTGAAIPLPALFQWLRGQAADAPGWSADLSRIGSGHLQASRQSPQPAVQLRLVLEQ